MNFLVPNPVVYGAEDCLYLNVYRPHRPKITERPGSAKLPVMVYIHGGAFFSGAIDQGIHGPGYFMDNGKVILVLMQYRLSTLGFLATGDAASPGNYGLKDQVMAMKWVKDNIAAFGGNPESITIFGQSAGGASVHMHMLSPSAKGLFAQAIAMSGSAIGPYNFPTMNPLELTRQHAKVVGLDNADSVSTAQLIDRLREVDASLLISSVDALKFFDVDPLTLYRPVVEPKNVAGAYLTDTPLNLLRSGKYTKVPFMTGLVQVEGAVRAAAIIVNEPLKEQLNQNMSTILPLLMDLQLKGSEREEFTGEIINKYLPSTGKVTPENEKSFIKVSLKFIYFIFRSLILIVWIYQI